MDQLTISTDFSPHEKKEDAAELVTYEAQRMIGHGSFGAVFIAKILETGETVAIKKVLLDPRFKNRELQILRMISKQPHPYIVSLRHYFVSKGAKSEDIFLNLVMDFVPDTIFSIARYFAKRKELMPIFSVKLYVFQLARALAHIHGLGICHRDIKPHNLLVDPHTMTLKLCDFGSAKVFVPGEPNVAYICSRFYRAPELIFGSTDYTFSIDVWSMGCVFAELLIGNPLFPGHSGVDQLVEIIKILGTPTKEELKTMNPSYQEFKFPQIRAFPWGSIFRPGTPSDVVDCIGKMLCFNPSQRINAIESCAHACFLELRDTGSRQQPELVTSSQYSPVLLQFTPEELSLATPSVRNILIPSSARSIISI